MVAIGLTVTPVASKMRDHEHLHHQPRHPCPARSSTLRQPSLQASPRSQRAHLWKDSRHERRDQARYATANWRCGICPGVHIALLRAQMKTPTRDEVFKILDELENYILQPSQVARQARRIKLYLYDNERK